MVALAGTSFDLLLIGRVLGGLGFSSFVVGIVSYQSAYIPPEERGLSFSLVTVGSILPIATLVPLIEYIASQNPAIPFLWIAPAIGLAALPVGQVLASSTPKNSYQKPRWGSYLDLLKVPGYKALFLFQFYLSFSEALSLSLPNYAEKLHLSLSLFVIPAAIASISLRIAGFKLLERFQRVLLVPPAAVLIVLGFFFTGLYPNMITFTVGGALFGLGMGVAFPTHLSLIGDLLPKGLLPKGTAVLFFAGDLAWTISPLLVGLAKPALSERGIFLLLPLFTLLAISSTIHLLWKPFCATYISKNKRENTI